MREIPPVHPGEMLREEFLKPLGMTGYELAKALKVPEQRIYALLREKRGISADTSIRLGRYFGVGAEFFMRIQSRYDLETAMDKVGEKIEREVAPRKILENA